MKTLDKKLLTPGLKVNVIETLGEIEFCGYMAYVASELRQNPEYFVTLQFDRKKGTPWFNIYYPSTTPLNKIRYVCI